MKAQKIVRISYRKAKDRNYILGLKKTSALTLFDPDLKL